MSQTSGGKTFVSNIREVGMLLLQNHNSQFAGGEQVLVTMSIIVLNCLVGNNIFCLHLNNRKLT